MCAPVLGRLQRRAEPQAGAKGWIGVTLPEGVRRRRAQRLHALCAGGGVFILRRARGSHWIVDRQSAPLILKYGTEAQKRFTSRACRGEASFIGMSEPWSLASTWPALRRAPRPMKRLCAEWPEDLTTNAHHCQYMIALVRTSAAARQAKACPRSSSICLCRASPCAPSRICRATAISARCFRQRNSAPTR